MNIKELAERQEQLWQEIDTYYQTEIVPQIDTCESLEELRVIWGKVSRECYPLDMPGLLFVEKAFSFDKVKQKLI